MAPTDTGKHLSHAAQSLQIFLIHFANANPCPSSRVPNVTQGRWGRCQHSRARPASGTTITHTVDRDIIERD
ncbi:hypothetical protein BJX68DRAFT_229270 [Aspergillus pseudodeflectus]|uniref:Uncharacterized protein n=1 Tax=Aspergillus pseudodeflectus TaxID=176178 RepID=A0ABR4KZY6_9EURO